MQTEVPFGSALSAKVYGAAVFAELIRTPGLSKNLTGPAPKIGQATGKLEKLQTSPNYPCVRVTDLSNGKGASVSVDLFNILEGKPVMGDEKLSGRMMSLSSSSMDIKLNQIRGGVDTGGRMTRQRTVHDLRSIGRAGLVGWYTRFLDQNKLVHLAGARGFQDAHDWVIPLESDPDYADIMVNTVNVPTYDRHFYAGGNTTLTGLDATDILKLDDIDRLRSAMEESEFPLQPIVMPDDPASTEDGLYVLLVSARVYHYLINRSDAKAIRTFHQYAQTRGASNPLFKGECGMWNGILVKRMPRLAIRYPAGATMTLATSADTFATTTAAVPAFGGADGAGVDRSILLGAQALAEVYGMHTASGSSFNWHEEKSDHGNTLEASVSAIMGTSKLRFTNKAGKDFDHGVAVIDSYAPNPKTVAIA